VDEGAGNEENYRVKREKCNGALRNMWRKRAEEART
jgi:hypothetical protein